MKLLRKLLKIFRKVLRTLNRKKISAGQKTLAARCAHRPTARSLLCSLRPSVSHSQQNHQIWAVLGPQFHGFLILGPVAFNTGTILILNV